jgi:hypothetical protein
MIKIIVLTSCKCLESTPNPTPPPLARLHRAWAFVHVWEYIQVIHALVANTLVAPFDEIVRILCLLHPLVKVDFPPFVDDFHLEILVTLNQKAFIFNLAHSSCPFSNGPSGMVYELLQDCFVK